ncbi:hypothetical protein RRG08_014911 [Elysia crispata]|uniref:Uncharacterized protein n=1 Tax=Elysia crispata TaxID=231223 RepID=A0AAE0ZWF2_9GAST|nr:hypothetical protein RRG08_014911 [Elysia crispata]
MATQTKLNKRICKHHGKVTKTFRVEKLFSLFTLATVTMLMGRRLAAQRNVLEPLMFAHGASHLLHGRSVNGVDLPVLVLLQAQLGCTN